MVKVRKRVSVSPKTITAVSRGKGRITRERRARANAQPVTVIRVDLRVWKKALKLAKGNTSRLCVIDNTTVVIENHPRKHKRV